MKKVFYFKCEILRATMLTSSCDRHKREHRKTRAGTPSFAPEVCRKCAGWKKVEDLRLTPKEEFEKMFSSDQVESWAASAEEARKTEHFFKKIRVHERTK